MYSPGYGAGWVTWNADEIRDLLLTHPGMIELVEAKTAREEALREEDATDETKCAEWVRFDEALRASEDEEEKLLKQLPAQYKEVIDDIRAKAKELGEDYVCLLGVRDLQVAIVNGPIRIKDYDGSESIDYGSNEFY